MPSTMWYVPSLFVGDKVSSGRYSWPNRHHAQAKEMGILESVMDEGKYWYNRDVEALIKEVGMWNRMIAACYGRIRDRVEAAGGDARVIEAEIAKFRDFERLEAEGRVGE